MTQVFYTCNLIQPRIDRSVGARLLKSVLSCWGNSLCKNTSINTNCNPPLQTYYQLPTNMCCHRALSLDSAVNVQCWRTLYWPSEHLLPINPALSSWISNFTSASKELVPQFPGSKTYKTLLALLHPPHIGPISIDDEWWDRRPMLGEISKNESRVRT